jgi:NHLM bacteriocin system ABC transporter peptidase/ATP-binding protein
MTTRRIRTPLFLQFEAAECGAAALGIILRYYGRYVPLEELRQMCGVSRDGTNALNLVRAARAYGLEANGLRRGTLKGLQNLGFPLILFWNFNHYVVLEGLSEQEAYLNDPAQGRRTVTLAEFDGAYTGVVITCKPTDNFERAGRPFRLRQALRQRLRGAEVGVVALIIISLFLLVPGFMIPALLQFFVDTMLMQGQQELNTLILGLAAALVLRVVLLGMQQALLLRLETWLSLRTMKQFFRHLLHLPLAFFSQRYTGDIALRVLLNQRLAALLTGDLASAVLNVLLMVFYGLLMLRYDGFLTLIGVLYAVSSFAALQAISRLRQMYYQRWQQQEAQLAGSLLNGVQAFDTIKANGAEDDMLSRWIGLQVRVVNQQQQLGRVTQGYFTFLPFLMAVNTTIVLIIGAGRVMEGTLSLGMLVAFQSLMYSFSQPVERLASLASEIQEVRGDLTRLDDVLRYPAESETKSGSVSEDEVIGYLDMHDVTFGYNPLDTPLIRQFGISLRPGEMCVIRGASGTGKSTLARLAAGLYTPTKGYILLDGHPVLQMQNAVSLVDQQITLFAGTFRDNITLWDASVPQDRIERAAKDACIHDLIMARGGYSALVSENGYDLSGGQRQCLEIARALARNPSLLILDEATSALDMSTEQQVYENVRRRRGCTCLVIAHRSGVLAYADQVVTLEAADE